MTRPGRLLLLAAIEAAFVWGCTDAQVNRIGPARPSRPAGCAVDIVAEGAPSYPVDDVASGVVSCSGARARCLEEIKKMACAVGADTVYGLSETASSGFTNISATYAARR